MYGYHMTTAGWIASIALMVLVVALVVGVVVWLIRAQNEANAAPRPESSAREILDRRLAAGEIEEPEYRRLRDALSHGSPPAAPPPVRAA